jgi:NAD(P)-dependent dehydrogenase (short-subunit alcohol dehydrogenase family)
MTSARTATTAAEPTSLKPQKEGTMTDHKTGTREQSLAARLTLAGQRVVVIGGTSGMGAATVRAARDLGADVVSAGRRPLPERKPADGVREVIVDTTNEESVRALFESIGELDHLLVTASPGQAGRLLDQDLAQARSFMDGKFFGSWTCARYGAPRLRPRGSITFVTGGSVIRPRAGASMITAAFAAVEGLTRALAVELGPLRVNAIRPSYTDTEFWSFLSEQEREDFRRRVAETAPVRRAGAPEDVAQGAIFLMTNPQVTGTILEITGGDTLVNNVD